jgi:hypothetical protein
MASGELEMLLAVGLHALLGERPKIRLHDGSLVFGVRCSIGLRNSAVQLRKRLSKMPFLATAASSDELQPGLSGCIGRLKVRTMCASSHGLILN